MGGRLVLYLRGRHVRGRADVRELRARGCPQVRGAEIRHLDVGAAYNHDVRRLDVTVNDTLPKRVIEGATALEGDLYGVFRREKLPRRGVLEQIAPRSEERRVGKE